MIWQEQLLLVICHRETITFFNNRGQCLKVVVGLGMTGLSCIDYLLKQGESVVAMDTAVAPSGYDKLRAKHPDLPCFLGGLDAASLQAADEIVLSPGVPPQTPLLQACGKPLIGDIELFARANNKPVYAITGSNGKTTVTALLAAMVEQAKSKVVVAGNMGVPVLDHLRDDAAAYVLELSSFQLDTTPSLTTRAAVVLNISPDHLDRYASLDEYLAAKQRIYQHCEYPIVNLDEQHIWLPLQLERTIRFSINPSADYADYGVRMSRGKLYLAHGCENLLPVERLALHGEHNWQNALVALIIAKLMGLPFEAILAVLRDFPGLPHRCQRVRTINGVTWYNDSKGTNIGATATAINSIGKATSGKLILLAGGLGKGADFQTLQSCLRQQVSQAILFGQDAPLLAQAWQPATTVSRVNSLEEAVKLAHDKATAGDSVLLSPACASFDMFTGFEDRGNQFMTFVKAL